MVGASLHGSSQTNGSQQAMCQLQDEVTGLQWSIVINSNRGPSLVDTHFQQIADPSNTEALTTTVTRAYPQRGMTILSH